MKPTITVLIVDDEVEFAETITQRLQIRGYSCQMASSGGAGLDKIREQEFDVAVIDLRMPDISGLQLLAKIKEHSPHCEVIILTGHGSYSSGQEGMNQGAFDYLMKPIDLQLLMQKIDDAWQKRGEKNE